MKKLLTLILSLSITIAAVNPCAVYAAMTDCTGKWKAQTGAQESYMTADEDGVTFNVPNSGSNGWGDVSDRTEFDYVLGEAIDGGNVTVSYEFKANAALQQMPKAAEIRFTDSEDNAEDDGYALSIINAVKAPKIYDCSDDDLTDTLVSDDLSANNWHSASYSFYISDGGIELKQAVIDDEDVNGVMAYIHNSSVKSLKAIEFFFYGNKTNKADYELSIRNMTVTSGFDEIEITSDIENGATDVTTNKFNLTFSHALTADSADGIVMLDENGNPVDSDRYSVALAADGESAVITMKTNEADSGRTYKIVAYADSVQGKKSEVLSEDFEVSFTFGTIEPAPSIVISSDIESGAENVIPANMKFKLDSNKDARVLELNASSFDKSKIKVYDEDDNEAADVTVESYLDTAENEISVTLYGYQPAGNYTVKILSGVAEGIGGECVDDDYALSFKTSYKETVKAKWVSTWWNNKAGTSMTLGSDGVAKFDVVNDGVTYEDEQGNRKSFAYSFAETVTGKNIPLTISYKFKTNEALTKTNSPVRFYGAEKTLGGCFNVSYAYSSLMYDNWYSYHKLNKPDGVDSVIPDEWHTVSYTFVIDSTNGSVLTAASYDGVPTNPTTTNDQPMTNKNVKGIQNIDFWFYSTKNTKDRFALEVKDLSVVKGSDIITYESEIEDGAVNVDGKDMKLTFSEKLYFDDEVKEVIKVVDSDNNAISDEKYSVTMSEGDTVAYVTMNTDDRDSEKTYKIFVDKSKVHGKNYSVLLDDIYISFTLPKINPKATLGIEAELPQNSTDVTPNALKFNFVPLPNDRISDVSEYEISADAKTDLNSAVKILNADDSVADYVFANAVMSDDCKSFTVSMSNYERYTGYKISIPAGSIVGADGEIMKDDFVFAFETSEIDKPPYKEQALSYKSIVNPPTRTSEDGVDTYVYKNKQGASQGDFCYALADSLTNAEGPLEISFKFQMNDAMVKAQGNAMRGILTDSSNISGFFTINSLNAGATMTDWTHYITLYNSGTIKAGVTDDDPWYTLTYIIDLDNGVIKNRYAQLNGGTLVEASAIDPGNKSSFGAVRFLIDPFPDADGNYNDYVFRIKDVKVKEVGALQGSVTTEDNKNLSLRFTYDVPYIFESDIVISEQVNGQWQEIKQPYRVAEMDSSDMKQINIVVEGGGLAYNKNYRVTLNRKGITADKYVQLKITDIDFKTKEYPDNVKADVNFTTSEPNATKLNCSITNLQSQAIENAFVIIAGYNAGGELVDKYCTNITSLAEGGNHSINDVSLSGEIKNVKVFIFKDDIKFGIYHMPQNFEK